MKKILLLLLALALLAGCASAPQPSAPSSQPESSVSESAEEDAGSVEESAPEEEADAEEEIAVKESLPETSQGDAAPANMADFSAPLIVMDASRYEGVVDDFAVSDQGYTVLMMKPSHDSQEALFPIAITENTQFSFPSNELGNGAELQIYYQENAETGTAEAIAINRITTQTTPMPAQIPADALTYRGSVTEVRIDQQNPLSGAVTMNDLEGGNPYTFNFSEETTLLNLDMAAVKAGDLLEIKHSPVSTRSIPPQSAAYEISEYFAA